MPTIKLILILVSSLLLVACQVEPTVDIGATDKQDSSGKRKRVELTKQAKDKSAKIARIDTALVIIPAMQEKASVESNGIILAGVELPDEMMLHIFSYLTVPEIFQAGEVCKHWYRISEEPVLWKIVRLHIHGDYPITEATKENAKKHMLRVQVNTLTDCAKIELLVRKYALHNEHPFIRYKALLGNILDELGKEMLEEYASQGHEMAISLKIDGLANGIRGYKKDLAAACALNEYWSKQGNGAAIQRKIESLAGYADYGYEENPEAAARFNEELVEQGNLAAIGRKIQGLTYGDYGYKQNPAAAMEFNEQLIQQGNQLAIERKIESLAEGEYGYVKDLIAAVKLNEHFIQQGHEAAIERKIYGLAYGEYGYKKSPIAAVEVNEYWIRQGNEQSIQRKVEALAEGKYGYTKDLTAAVTLNEQLIQQGNQAAIERKLMGLSNASKIGGYMYGLQQLQFWLAEEEQKGTRWAYYLKAQTLKYGILGYEQDRDAATQYIIKHHIPY